MIKRVLVGVSLASMLAASAQAQSAGGSLSALQDEYNSSSVNNFGTSTLFEIWCMDNQPTAVSTPTFVDLPEVSAPITPEWVAVTPGYSAHATVAAGSASVGADFVNTTPEPATMSLLAMGLAGMAGARLRRKK